MVRQMLLLVALLELGPVIGCVSLPQRLPEADSASACLPDAMRLARSQDEPVLPADNGKKENGEKSGNGNGKEEEERKHIQDNSFLIEEAYNQEKGVVQHIFNWINFWDHAGGRSRDFTFNYTMEVPLGSQDHQFSFVIPMINFYDEPDGGPITNNGGFGDIFLNYRYQLSYDDEHSLRPAIAPRFSVILPSGDEDRGLGLEDTGFQFNLPISKQLEPFAFHFNAGLTYVPDADFPLDGGLISPEHDLHSYNLGFSAIWLASYDFNLMLETVIFWNDGISDAGGPDRTTEIIINPGFRWAAFTAEDIQWVLGASVPIGLSDDAPDIGVFGYMSVEHTAKKQKDNGNGGS